MSSITLEVLMFCIKNPCFNLIYEDYLFQAVDVK